MSTGSASPQSDGTGTPRRILVWDAPVRVFHWLLVLCFVGAWLTAESERWRLAHVTLGYTMAGLVAFRLVWGLVGTRHARFASFVRRPAAVLRYLRSILSSHAEHHTGHNPAGAVAIVLLLLLTLLTTVSGWAAYNEIAARYAGEWHEGLANTMLMLVVVHIAGVVAGSLLHRENLVAAMLTGRKSGAARDAIRRPWRAVAVLLIAGVVGFWIYQWRAAPTPAGGNAQLSASTPSTAPASAASAP